LLNEKNNMNMQLIKLEYTFFEIKSQTLNMFQLYKKWRIYIIIILWSTCMIFNIAHLNLHPICKHWCIDHKWITFFWATFLLLFFFYGLANHWSSHIFNSINDKHWKKIGTLTSCSWDVISTCDLISSQYFLDCYFDYYNTMVDSTHVCKIIDEIWRFEVMNTILLNIPKRLCIFLYNISWIFYIITKIL
jgi:hypothetical protein